MPVGCWLDGPGPDWHRPGMKMKPAIKELTPADWVLHQRSLSALREQLFRVRTPESLYVAGEFEIIEPHVLVVWYPEPPERTLLTGGLAFTVDFPGAWGPSRYTIQHSGDDRYWLHATFVDHRSATFTRFSRTETFARMPQFFITCVDTMAQDCARHPAGKTT